MARRQAGAGRNEADKPIWDSNGDPGRHQRALPRCQHSPGAGVQIDTGIPGPRMARQRKLGVELLDEYLQAVHVSDKSTGVPE